MGLFLGQPGPLRPELVGVLPFQVDQHRLNVLAGAQGIGLVIGTGAAVLQFEGVADLDIVGVATAALDPIEGQNLAGPGVGEVDGVGPPLGTTTLREYFERLAADDPDA